MDNSLFRQFSSSGGGFIVNRLMLKTFGAELAVFLCDLADRDNFFKSRDGWFYCTKEKRMEALGMSERTISRLMKEAVNAELVFTEMRGIPPKQFIWVNYDLIQGRLEETLNISNVSENADNYLRENADNILSRLKTKDSKSFKPSMLEKNTPLETPSKSRRTTPPIIEDIPQQLSAVELRTKEMLPLASQLSDIVRLRRNVKINPSQIIKWANEIRLLCDKNGVNPARVRRALDWYADNNQGEYALVIESGAALREKFLRLEAQMERSKLPPSTPAAKKPGHSWNDKPADEKNWKEPIILKSK